MRLLSTRSWTNLRAALLAGAALILGTPSAHGDWTVTKTWDDGTGTTPGTLSYAILQANAGFPVETITLNLDGGATTITQTGSLPAYTFGSGVLYVRGSWVTLDGQGFDQFTNAGGGYIYIQDMILTGGDNKGPLTVLLGPLQIGDGSATDTSITGSIANYVDVIFDTAGTITYSGVMSGVAVNKNGSGTLVLSGANSFSHLNLREGTLRLEHNSAAGTGTITTYGSVIDYADGVDIANDIVISSVTTQFQVLAGATATQSGLIQEDAFSRPLEKIGEGTLIVNAVINTGPTIISAGIWQAGADLAFSGNSAHTVAAGATLDLGGYVQAIDSLFGAGLVTNSGATDVTLVVGNFGTSTTESVFDGVIQDGATNNLFLMLDGPKLTLTGDNTYTGGTLICDCSVLQIGNGGTTGSIVGEVTNNGFLIFNRSDDYEFSGDILQGFGNPGVVEQKGPGVLTLSGNNDYAGGTLISGGTLRIDSDGRLGDVLGGVGLAGGSTLSFSDDVSLDASRTITLDDGGTIDTDGNDNEILGTVTGTGGLTVNGGGYLYLGGANDFTGGVTIIDQTMLVIDNDGALGAASNGITLNDGGILFEDDMTIGAGRTMTLAGGENVLDLNGYEVEVAGRITGVGTLVVVNGCGCTSGLILTAANDFSGGLMVGDSTIVTIRDDNNLGAAAGTLTLAGGALRLDAGVTLNASRAIELESFGGAFETNGFTGTILGDITGNGDLVQSGPGTLILAGNNSHTGSLVVDGGTMVLTGNNAPATAAVVLDGTLQIGDGGTRGALTGSAPIAILDTLIFNRSDTVTFDQVIVNVGTIEQKGSGTTILGGTNTMVGNVLLTAGILQINNANALDAATVIFNGGTLQAVIDGADVYAPFLVDAPGGTISVTGSNSLILSNSINDGTPGGVLTKTGSGTLILTASNSFTGTTVISEGILQIGNGGTSGDLGSGTVVTNAVLAFNRSDVTIISSVISGTGGVTQKGSAALQFTAAQTYGGMTTIDAGTRIDLTGNGAVSASQVASNGTFDISGIAASGTAIRALTGSGFVPLGSKTLTITAGTGVFSGVISGTGSLDLAGGITTLTGNNTYSGGTTVSGTLSLGSSGAAGTGPIITTGSVVDYAHGVVINNPIVLGSNTTQLQALAGVTATQAGVISEVGGSRPIEKIGAGTLIITAPSTYTGATTITAGTWRAGAANVLVAGSSYAIASGGTLDLNGFAGSIAGISGAGNVALGSGTLTLTNSSDNSFAGVISGSGSLVKAGSGMLTLTGAGDHANTILSAGTLRLGDGGTSGSLAGNVNLAAGTVLAFNRANSLTLAGVLSGAGSVRQQGAGTTILNGISSYTGATEALAGTLAVNGAITSTASVASGARLGGTGTVGAVVLSNGATLAPGNSIGTLTVAGNASFAAGSIYEVEVNAAGQSDRLNAATASLAGAVRVLPEAGDYGFETTYRILEASGGLTGSFGAVISAAANLHPELIYGASSVDLRLTRNDMRFGTQFGITPNQIAAGDAASVGGVSSSLYRALGQLSRSVPGVRAAMDELSGEIHASLRAAAIQDGRIIRNMVRGEALQDAAGLRLWASAFGSYGALNADGNAADLHHNDAGFIAGADMPLAEGLRAGLAGGYSEQKVSVAHRASTARGHRGHVIAYAGWKGESVSLSAGADFGWGKSHVDRRLPSLAQTASASRDTSMTQLFGDLSVPLDTGIGRVEPYANLAWVSVSGGAFTETGGNAALSGAEASDAQTYSTLGARLSPGGVPLGGATLVPRFDLGWTHAFSKLTPARVVTLAGQSFTVRGTPLFEDAATVQADLAVALGEGIEAALGYDGAISHRGQNHGGRLSLRWTH